MKKSNFLLVIFAVSFCASSFAQTFRLDPDFGINGKTLLDQFYSGAVNSIALQPDGKIVAAGLSIEAGGSFDFTLFRLEEDGALDPDFGDNGIVVTSISNSADRAHSIVLQPDGKILAAGFVYDAVQWDFALARYLPNGAIDVGFGTNGFVTTDFAGKDDFAYSVKLQADGKIVVAGYAVNGSDPGDIALVRYLPNGMPDENFGTSGKVISGLVNNDRASCLLIKPDGKILVGGWANSTAGTLSFILAQYTEAGILDSGFGNNGMAVAAFGTSFNLMYDILLQPDGKIVAIGNANANWKNSIAVLRYNPNGTLDLNFAAAGIRIISNFGQMEGYSVALQPDGKIIVGGFVGDYPGEDFALLRLLPDGALDDSFGTFSGLVKTEFNAIYDQIYSIALQPDGSVVAAGHSSTVDPNLSHPVVLRFKEQAGNVGLPSLPNEQFSIRLGPNPVIQNAHVEYELKEEAIVSIQLADVTGKVLKTICLAEKQAMGKHRVQIEYATDLEPGFYLVSISIGEAKTILKTIKQ